MNYNDTSTAPRTAFITALAWVMMIGGAIFSAISFLALLMTITWSHNSPPGDAFGFLTVIVAPPLSFVAGICLLRRRRWAYIYAIAALVVFIGVEVRDGARIGATEQHFLSPDGVPTTVLGSSPTNSFPKIVMAVGLLAMLLLPKARAEFAKPLPAEKPHARRNWRVGHQGRDMMYYEELHGEKWERIAVDGEMLMGRAHHVIYFASAEQWVAYPEWARGRRDEIIARIKADFHAPDYEYRGEPSAAPAFSESPLAQTQRSVEPPALPVPKPPSKRQQFLAGWFSALLLLAPAGWMSWLVVGGFQKGETVYPSKHASQRRSVSRVTEPAMFWFCIGLYTAIGAGALGLTVWGVAVCRKAKN